MPRIMSVLVVVGLMLAAQAEVYADSAHDVPLNRATPQQIHADLGVEAYQNMIAGLADQGLQLASASASRGPNGVRFSAIVEPAEPGRTWLARHGQTRIQAWAFIDEYVGRQGWSLRALDIYRTVDGFRYIVIVEDRPRRGPYQSPQLAVSGTDWQSFFNERVANGQYPKLVSMASDEQGRLVVSSYFAAAPSLEFLAWQGRTQRQIIRDHQRAARRGYNPISFNSYPAANGRAAFSAVWTTAAPAADILLNIRADRLELILAELQSQGRRILNISAASDSRGQTLFSLHVARGANNSPLNPDGAEFPISTHTSGSSAGPSATTRAIPGSGGRARDFSGGFSGGNRVVPSGGSDGSAGGGGGGNAGSVGSGGGDENGGGDDGAIPGRAVQPGEPVWCNYYTFGGSHVDVTIRSPGDSPLLSRNWGVSYCDDELHRSEVDRGRRAEDHALGIRVPWAQATNVSEAATCLRNHRRNWIWEASDDPDTRRVWEQVAGSIWDGVDADACEACGNMIAIAGMNYCRHYGFDTR